MTQNGSLPIRADDANSPRFATLYDHEQMLHFVSLHPETIEAIAKAARPINISVVMENAFPIGVFSTEEKAVQFGTDYLLARARKAGSTTRSHIHYHNFTLDLKEQP